MDCISDLASIKNTWGPEVDKVWDAWQAEVKKMKKPEFVSAEDVDFDDDEEEVLEMQDAESNARPTDAEQLLMAHAEISDEDGPSITKTDAKARAQKIKKHVTKVVHQKKRETLTNPVITQEIDYMGEIEKYTQFGFLKKKILITMANTMDRSEVSKLRQWFLDADTLDTGTITLQELKIAFKKVSPDADDEKIEFLFHGIDRDQSGHIHYDEFLAALSESHGLVTMDRLTEAFDRIDKE
jgi:hypothetical protein